jgi:hypothetical protein
MSSQPKPPFPIKASRCQAAARTWIPIAARGASGIRNFRGMHRFPVWIWRQEGVAGGEQAVTRGAASRRVESGKPKFTHRSGCDAA